MQAEKKRSSQRGDGSSSYNGTSIAETRHCHFGKDFRLLAAIILSAGASIAEMGRAKALLPLYRESTFLGHLMQITRHPSIGVTRVGARRRG